jgi:DNA-binding IclR family transcriptional regulator
VEREQLGDRVDLDREFMERFYEKSGPSLDTEVATDEIARELGLDEQQTRELLARLVRIGHLREVGAGYRMKITIRGISFAEAKA